MNSMYSYTGVATMATAMLVVIGVFAVIGLACLALFIVGEWKVFKKAGYEGWISLVPFYNTYTLSKIVWGNGWCMQQINYSREDLNGNDIDCFTIIKEDKANRYPL